jgi:type IV pilus assembly protein PilE
MRYQRQSGFTLIEVMIVVVIIAILVGVGLPSYNNAITRSNRADAQAALMGFAQAMERRYQQNLNYLSAATGGSDTGTPDPTVYVGTAPVEGRALYNLTIAEANPNPPYFRLRATPIAGGRQDGDGILEIDSLGTRGWDRDNNGTIGAAERTWER